MQIGMNWVIEQLFRRWLSHKLYHFVERVDKPLSGSYDKRYNTGLIFDGCLFFMIVDKVHIIGEQTGGSPKEKSIDPPS